MTIESLPQRLGANDILRKRIGTNANAWKVREIGDGNLNLVFVVEGESGAVIVKQALPYVRMVGESWPLSIRRNYFEYHALSRQAVRDPGRVPDIYLFDEEQAIIVMEYLSPHVMLRQALIAGQQFPRLARDLGVFSARTLFRGSDLHMSAEQRKNDMALFAKNIELCGITENLVFSDPYFEAAMNRHTSPQLDNLVTELRSDRDLKVEAQRLKHIFATSAETMLHGDLHTGSVMVTEDNTRVIDAEFAFYGPMAFDVGVLIANFWTAFFSQRGHEAGASRDAMRSYLLTVIVEVWESFVAEFSMLWRTERSGILYQRTLFEECGDTLGAEQASAHVLRSIWVDMLGFAGVEIHRRILGLAHNAEFETIEDADLRSRCETGALKLGRHLVINRRTIETIAEVNSLAVGLDSATVS